MSLACVDQRHQGPPPSTPAVPSACPRRALDRDGHASPGRIRPRAKRWPRRCLSQTFDAISGVRVWPRSTGTGPRDSSPCRLSSGFSAGGRQPVIFSVEIDPSENLLRISPTLPSAHTRSPPRAGRCLHRSDRIAIAQRSGTVALNAQLRVCSQLRALPAPERCNSAHFGRRGWTGFCRTSNTVLTVTYRICVRHRGWGQPHLPTKGARHSGSSDPSWLHTSFPLVRIAVHPRAIPRLARRDFHKVHSPSIDWRSPHISESPCFASIDWCRALHFLPMRTPSHTRLLPQSSCSHHELATVSRFP